MPFRICSESWYFHMQICLLQSWDDLFVLGYVPTTASVERLVTQLLCINHFLCPSDCISSASQIHTAVSEHVVIFPFTFSLVERMKQNGDCHRYVPVNSLEAWGRYLTVWCRVMPTDCMHFHCTVHIFVTEHTVHTVEEILSVRPYISSQNMQRTTHLNSANFCIVKIWWINVIVVSACTI